MRARRILSMLALCAAISGYAQNSFDESEGFPTIPIHRVPCVEHDAAEDEAGARIMRSSGSQADAQLKASGSPKILVCLANFSDVSFTVAGNNGELMTLFDKFFNGKNEGAGDNPNSVADYFRAMSNGVFTPEFIITEPVTVSKKRAEYGSTKGSNARMAYRNEALAQLSAKIKNRVSEYDTNGDNKIDGVVIVFPGWGATTGDANCIHPCCWTNDIAASGVNYATALVVPELLSPDEPKLNGIGVYVHEMSHMLGLPDFYDINYKGSGMDYWSLMDLGEYWQNGYMPTAYTAYERNFMGWAPLTELSAATSVRNMKTVAQGGSAYIVYNDGNKNEYYILETLSDSDPWNKTLCSSLGNGLIIYHVDFDNSAWSNNRVNTNVSRQRMTIVPANGHFEIADNFDDDPTAYISELRGHLWPLKSNASVVQYWGIAGNNELTDEERTQGDRIAPAARLYNRNTDGSYFMHKPITSIVYDAETKSVSFDFMGGGSTGIEDDVVAGDHAGDHPLKVFSMDGRTVSTLTENGLYTLPSGVYVVKDMVTGKTTKRILGRQQ